MKLNGAMGLHGYITMRHYRNGELLSEDHYTNTITNMGIDQVAGLINGQRTSVFDTIAIGTSAVAASSATTGLLAIISAGSLAPAACTCTQITTDTTNDTARFLHTFAATATYTIKECGVLTSASSARIIGRKTFDSKALTSGDTLQIDYRIDVD